jgi:ABC-type phosphate transport system permease subunit
MKSAARLALQHQDQLSSCQWSGIPMAPVLVILSGVIISLIDGALPAIRAFGFDFLVEERWNPVTEKFGAFASIYGTLITSFIAMLFAVPFGLLIALFLTELCPMWLRRPIGIAIELLAGIPSIIYGIWGLFVFAPFLQRTLQPTLIDFFGDNPWFGTVPVLSTLFEGPPYGIGMLTAGLILAIMVLPFVTSISRDVFEAVPAVLKEAAYGVKRKIMGAFDNLPSKNHGRCAWHRRLFHGDIAALAIRTWDEPASRADGIPRLVQPDQDSRRHAAHRSRGRGGRALVDQHGSSVAAQG